MKLEEVNDLIYSTFCTFKKTAGKEALLDPFECRANIERIHDQHRFVIFVLVNIINTTFHNMSIQHFTNRYSYHQLSVKFLQMAITDQWKSSNNIAVQRNSSNICLKIFFNLL